MEGVSSAPCCIAPATRVYAASPGSRASTVKAAPSLRRALRAAPRRPWGSAQARRIAAVPVAKRLHRRHDRLELVEARGGDADHLHELLSLRAHVGLEERAERRVEGEQAVVK